MKSPITNCNSNDQLLQLVSIQLLQKAYFRQFPHLAAKLADREAPTPGSSSSSTAANARSYLSQFCSKSDKSRKPRNSTTGILHKRKQNRQRCSSHFVQ